MITTLGQTIVNDKLPKDLQDHTRVLDGGTAEDLLKSVADSHTDAYKDVSKHLMQVGSEYAYLEGSTMGLDDLRSDVDKESYFKALDIAEDKLDQADLTDAEKEDTRNQMYQEVHDSLVDATYKSSLAKNNPLALQVKMKARGNPVQLTAIQTASGKFNDHKGKVLPIFIRRSYAEGLKPHEKYASTYGARAAVISTKFATRDAGDLGKQFTTATADKLITSNDCETLEGTPFASSDYESIGSLLARSTGGFPKGTPITKKMLDKINKQGIKNIVTRSVLTCQAPEGLCAACAGQQEDGKLPALHSHIGYTAGSALRERIAQSGLNKKHSGGQQAGGTKEFSGFDAINQMVQVPATFKDEAALATAEGKITKIQDAPQGGKYIYIGEASHYVPKNTAVLVKEGDEVEAGDQLADGLVNPRQVVDYKGIGEGRRYLTNRLTKMFKDSGMKAHRRNVEVVVRAIMDKVNIDNKDGLGGFLPGDTVSYTTFADMYRPRKDSTYVSPVNARGQFLEQPALHYTIGSPVTRAMIAELKEHGVDKIMTNKEKPGFMPVTERLRTGSTRAQSDWMSRLKGSYLKENLLEAARTGDVSNMRSVNPTAALAKGVGLGHNKINNKITY